MKSVARKIAQNKFSLFGLDIEWKVSRKRLAAPLPKKKPAVAVPFDEKNFKAPYCLHFGPGPAWEKPDNHWIAIDVDPERGDMVMDFQEFQGIPLDENTVSYIYGSHVFEHMSIWVTDEVFAESCRVLKPGGVMRLILPDAERSIREYAAGNKNFLLFSRRKERAARKGMDYTLFECMKEDFLSRASQLDLLGRRSLAHQNAWDYETIERDLLKAGFSQVSRSGFQQSTVREFSFEGAFPSEANEDYRSLYVEAVK